MLFTYKESFTRLYEVEVSPSPRQERCGYLYPGLSRARGECGSIGGGFYDPFPFLGDVVLGWVR